MTALLILAPIGMLVVALVVGVIVLRWARR